MDVNNIKLPTDNNNRHLEEQNDMRLFFSGNKTCSFCNKKANFYIKESNKPTIYYCKKHEKLLVRK